MFRKMPFILLSIILLVGLTSQWLPVSCQSFFYGISLSIKSLIIFLLPFVVFGLLFKVAVHFSTKASKIILLLLAVICCSNFISTLLSYSVGSLAYTFDLAMNFPNEAESLTPLWNFSFPKWIGNDLALFSGLLMGVILGKFKPSWAKDFSIKLEKIVNIILKGILLIIPLFVTGFVVKMNYDKILLNIIFNYALIFALIASSVFAYVILLYFIASKFQFKPFINNLKNMLPAALAGFGSMSSAAVMPLTIMGAVKNSKNHEMPKLIIPATVNIHLIGDCFAIPIFAFAVLKSFGIAEPTFSTYLVFAFYFVLAKFSVAAVPGGGILVMLPIIESYLGFNAEMLSLITALYILFDPIITCANVLGNGGFALLVEKMSKGVTNQTKFTDASLHEPQVIG